MLRCINGWCDIQLIEEFISASDRILGVGDLEIARKMGAVVDEKEGQVEVRLWRIEHPAEP